MWCEVLIDDYSIDGLTPHKTGILIGAKKEIFTLPVIFRFTKINRWVYNYGYDKPYLRFVDIERPLGHPIGPDALEIDLSTHFQYTWSSVSLDVFPQISIIGNGEGSLFEKTPVISAHNFGYSAQDFLTGNEIFNASYEFFAVLGLKRSKIKFLFSNQLEERTFRISGEYAFSD